MNQSPVPAAGENSQNEVPRTSLSRKAAYVLVAAAVASGIATVATMTGANSQNFDVQTVINLLYVDGALLLALSIIVVCKIIQVWIASRRGAAGAGLQVRLVVLFSLVAVTPAILVAVFSALYLNFGIENWFSKRVSTALGQSSIVARAYLQEHRKNILTDTFAIANNLNLNAPYLSRNRPVFDRTLSNHAALRSLSEAVVFDSSGQILGRTQFSLREKVDDLSPEVLDKANKGQIVVLGTEKEERLRALMRLNRFIDAYLLVERFVDQRVIGHIESIDRAVTQYNNLEKERGGIQISFVIIFLVVALLLLLAAAWIGLTVSTQLAKPISDLIDAAGQVSDGDLTVRVETTDDAYEISSLSRAFNTMTSQLDTQRAGLVEANQQLDERRRFTEAVLTGVTAGVIGLDSEQRIHLPNRSASTLLSTSINEFTGDLLADVVPEMADLLGDAARNPARLQQAEIEIQRDNQTRNLLVRVTAERRDDETIGYVVTFDDVTELQSAQRKAAWADVARRIAHEIKNPLTPIQLSAERLKRKYSKEIETDPDTFMSCTETIIRQVGDIGRMVDEFSSFARMPQPVFKSENLSEVCRQAVFLERNRNPDIDYELELPPDDIVLTCDRRQISQALTNLLKNAAESILGAIQLQGESRDGGRIVLSIHTGPAEEGAVRVAVADNGMGLPEDARERLTEPYVTTREKGTGLGLAIVRKIMEDHGGRLDLDDVPGGGAKVSLCFEPLSETDSPDQTSNEPPIEGGAVNLAISGD